MAFDQKTRNLLQRTVTACRRALDREFTVQLQELYGIQPDGSITPLTALDHLGDEALAVAWLLRERLNHLEAAQPAEAQTRTRAKPEHISRVIREQAFTVLNRLAALRLCEERGLVLECVRRGTNSEGFQLFLTSAGNALGDTHEAYCVYLQCLFDELSLDLGVLFDRFSPLALLFPRKDALEEVLHELNGSSKAAEGEGLSPEQFAEIWQADETIGWIYQYYNDEAERKKMREESSAPRNSRELAVRNQFFTPRYVVEFLTDNTLGRLWYEMTQGRTRLKDQCRYMVRRPDEVFLDDSTEADVKCPEMGIIEMGRLLSAGQVADFPEFSVRSRQEMIDLAHTVNGYARHDYGPWFEEARAKGQRGRLGELSTQDILDWLFLECRSDRHGGDGSIYSERWFIEASNEIRRRVLESRRGDLSQEQLLRAPVFIPYRKLKDPREIRLLDPACGSMHFGLYAFDLFTVTYDEAWEIAHGTDDAAKSAETFAPFVTFAASFADKAAFLREVPRLIIEHNIHGIDIDPRAAQIAGLSLWLRAQRAWHQAGVKPADRPRITRSNLVCAEPMPGEKELLREFVEQQFPAGERPAFDFLLEKIFDRMTLAGEAGSLLRIEEEIRAAIAEAKRLWKEGPKHE
ncbi:MAG: hypothetical protein FJ405_14130, partial [Verrucomicrobia bacterium]|nr:hypothetical protein [Verrucomicrobiota bacterium]